MNQFENLNVSSSIIELLNKENITEPTPIQKESIPYLLEGNDVIGQAQTGTGKTFAYAIPAIMKIDSNSKDVQVLILCPTRELSLQVSIEIKKLISNNKKLKVCTIYGGESYEKQFKELAKNPQIVVGTPGRIIDQINRGKLKFDKVNYLVLDEADEMLKMGFQEDLETIMATMPKNRQNALFSATLPPFITKIATKYMNNPKMVKIESKTLTVEAINQIVYYVKKESKQDLLIRILDYYKYRSVMIFANTKAMVDELVLFLQSYGFKADGLHGDLKQSLRDRVLQSFRSKSIQILIATDVAARGIDIDGIEAIINFDIPNENELYVHRIGRTGRAGSKGMAITISTSRGRSRIKELEAYTKGRITPLPIPSINDINSSTDDILFNNIMELAELNKNNHNYDILIHKIASRISDPVPIIIALLEMADVKSKRDYPEIEVLPLNSSKERKKESKNNKTNSKNSKDIKKKTKAVIEINVGEVDKIRPNQLVVLFHDELKIHREHFGKIVIKKKYTFIEINEEALRFLKGINKLKINGKSLNYRIVDSLPR